MLSANMEDFSARGRSPAMEESSDMEESLDEEESLAMKQSLALFTIEEESEEAEED